MARFLFILSVLTMMTGISCRAEAHGLEASLDAYEIRAVLGTPTIVEATLHNGTTYPLYLTGVQVVLTNGASGDVYNPALLQERLHKLDSGQTWDGPLVVIKAKHRGPLLAQGSIVLKGGASAGATDLLTSISLHLTIDDPQRNWDGSYVRGAAAVCDRSSDDCCDASESSCFQSENRCWYVAEGYDHQEVCLNKQAGKGYEHITDLRVSSDGLHAAYLASFQCQSGNHEEHCKRVVVVDQIEKAGTGAATHLELSPDGRHYAYVERESCILRLGEEVCAGASRNMVDGSPVTAMPAWY